MSEQEIIRFPQCAANQSTYLAIRNKILQLWSQDCRNELLLSRVIVQLSEPMTGLLDIQFIPQIYRALCVMGLINVGVFRRSPHTIYQQIQQPSPRRVIVVGAGVSGLAAARHLQTMGFQVNLNYSLKLYENLLFNLQFITCTTV